MKRTNLLLISICSMLLLLGSCRKSSRFEIDTTKNRVEVKIHRFDKDLLTIDTTKLNAGVDRLYKLYPEFLPVFTGTILDTAATNKTAVRNLFHQFLADTTFKAVNKKALQTFTDVTDIEKQVSDAYTYIHYYFPEVKLPEIYFFVSGFNRAVMINNNFIGVGTDFYLGSNYPGYKNFTYQYMLYNMRRECVATDLVSTTLFRMFVMNSSEYRLLDNMLFRGKIMYLLSVFMPNEKPENIMGYTPEQWKWCKSSEKQLWAYVIDQKHLFSTDVQLIRKYMNDAPFTAPVSQDSPGRLGTWLGWQIVESYMNKNPNATLTDLMKINNYQKMLEASGYRP
jgi:gliding motility-associated lipoprotein GldB